MWVWCHSEWKHYFMKADLVLMLHTNQNKDKQEDVAPSHSQNKHCLLHCLSKKKEKRSRALTFCWNAFSLCSLNQSSTIWVQGILVLSSWSKPVTSGKKKLHRWNNLVTQHIQVVSWPHNVAEPGPEQLQQPQITALPPQARRVDTRHDGSITSSASPLMLHHSGTG